MSTQKTIQDDIFDLFNDCINDNLSSDSSSSSSSYNVVKSFTVQDIEEEQIAIYISSMTNMQHGTAFDYQITVSIQGQTYIQNDSDKQQIEQLYGNVLQKIQGLTINDIESYVNNVAGFLIDSSNFDNDGQTHSFNISVRLFVCDLN